MSKVRSITDPLSGKTVKSTYPEDKVGPLLMHNYLTERGITRESAEACQLELMTTKEFCSYIGHKGPVAYEYCFAIPHANHQYVVARMLGERLRNNSKMGKSLCPATKVKPIQIYCPPLPQSGNILFVAESHVKAIAIAQQGHRVVAGNGVRCLYSHTGFYEGWPDDLIKSGEITEVRVLFDANWQTNKQVEAAVLTVTNGVRNIYPKLAVYEKRLPLYKGEDQGIDDYLARGGEEAIAWLANDEDLVAAQGSEFDQHLLELNEQYVICRNTRNIIDRLERTPMKKPEFTEVIEANRIYTGWVPSGKGFRPVEKSAAKEWLKSTMRKEVAKELYLPGSDEFGKKAGYTFYNTWYDDGVEATEGDIAPFLKVYKNAIPDAVERQLLIESLAWMLQNRGTRMEKCFSFIGADQGTGKSLLVETMGVIVGESNFVAVSPHNFTNNFNAAMTGKEIVLLDDLGPKDLQTQTKGLFKNFITGRSFLAEKKGKDAIKTSSTAVLFITSNEFGAIPLDAEDRRVHICTFNPTQHYPQGDKWWNEYVEWLEGDGYGIIRGWLEALDISKFDPNFMPPMTATKRHMHESNMNPVEAWVESLYHDPDAELLGNKRSYYTITELCILMHGAGWDIMDQSAKASTEKYMQVYLAKRYRRIGTCAVTTVNGRIRYWGIRKNGDESTAGDVKADVKSHQTLKA